MVLDGFLLLLRPSSLSGRWSVWPALVFLSRERHRARAGVCAGLAARHCGAGASRFLRRQSPWFLQQRAFLPLPQLAASGGLGAPDAVCPRPPVSGQGPTPPSAVAGVPWLGGCSGPLFLGITSASCVPAAREGLGVSLLSLQPVPPPCTCFVFRPRLPHLSRSLTVCEFDLPCLTGSPSLTEPPKATLLLEESL